MVDSMTIFKSLNITIGTVNEKSIYVKIRS